MRRVIRLSPRNLDQVCRNSILVPVEQWGDDPKLVALLGEQGAAGFRALFDAFPELVGVLWALRDADGRIEDFAFGYGNPAMLRGFRMPPETRDRYTLLEALPRMRSSRAFDAYVRTCDLGEPWVEEVTYDTPFGDGYMLGTFAHRVTKLGDGVMVFLTNITEQRRMEAELRGYADVVAHDLREPVANMALLVRALEQRADEPPRADVLQMLREGIGRAQELIEAVLGYARLGELRSGPVALRDVMSAVAEDLRPNLAAVGATLSVGDLPEVEGDPLQLRRVLQNLVGNAVKFRGEDPPRVEVSALRDRAEWVVTVRDNGIGVDPDQATRIFGMFSRVNAKADGVGIGLAICRRVVEAHGGRIWVEPAKGGGSAFRFTMPV
jgi:signal transduction histidine kinase